jgi:hypothetical protein
VRDARVADRTFGAHLEENVDERAALEVVPMKPLVEHVEDGQQALSGRGSAPPGLGLDELARPAMLAALQEREDESLLGAVEPI